MVGQTILKEGTLDVKPPATSFVRGWRYQPWKTRYVKLVDQNGIVELQVYDGATLKYEYVLENVTDITMVTSKTHLHAFEIIAGGKSLVILSGSSEIESRDWIWTLRKLFWPQALAEVEKAERLQLTLAPNLDSRRLGLETGVYELDVTVSAVSVNFVSASLDPRLTPVEPFTGAEPVRNLTIPLSTVGRYNVQQEGSTRSVTIETTPDFVHGKASLCLVQLPDADEDQSVEAIIELIKAKVFRATNNLHECIASTRWRLDHLE